MADAPVVHIGENSPERVAYKLMELIANLERRDLYASGSNPPDREWVLNTYGKCISTVRNGWYDPD